MNTQEEECGDKVMGGFKKRERIPARDRGRRGRRGKETYGSDYKPMMSCMYVR